jgi:hypothetical protein
MPRGSRPGERRGGRQRGIPNKKTLIKNAVFLAAAEDPNRSPLEFMLALMRDSQVPLDTRIDMAAAAAPFVHAKPEPVRNKRPDPIDLPDRLGEAGDLKFGKLDGKSAAGADGGLCPLDFLLDVMNDPAVAPRQRVRAARIASRYKHPYATVPDAPTVIVVEDKFGFKVDRDLARAERDDMLRRQALDANWFRFEKGSDEKKAADQEREDIRERHDERLARLTCPPDYTDSDRHADQMRLKQLHSKRLDGQKLTPEEDAKEAHLAARVASYELVLLAEARYRELEERQAVDYLAARVAPREPKPEGLAEARIRELEERQAVGYTLNTAEGTELQELRARYPEIAAKIDKIDLVYWHHYERELKIAEKAGLDLGAAIRQASDVCLRLKDHKKWTTLI